MRRIAASPLAARDAFDDADDAVTVAQAKHRSYAENDSKEDWEIVAAQVDVQKAERLLGRRTAALHAAEVDADAAQQQLVDPEEALDAALAVRVDAEPVLEENTAEPELYFDTVDDWVRC